MLNCFAMFVLLKVRNCHNHVMQTNPQHREKEAQNSNSRKALKTNQLSLTQQDDCKLGTQGPNTKTPQIMGATTTNESTTTT